VKFSLRQCCEDYWWDEILTRIFFRIHYLKSLFLQIQFPSIAKKCHGIVDLAPFMQFHWESFRICPNVFEGFLMFSHSILCLNLIMNKVGGKSTFLSSQKCILLIFGISMPNLQTSAQKNFIHIIVAKFPLKFSSIQVCRYKLRLK